MNCGGLVLSIVASLFLLNSQVFGQTYTYTYDISDNVISNPDRGLFVYGGDEIDHSRGCWWNDKKKFDSYLARLDDGQSKGMTLVYLQYDIGAYRTDAQAIPVTYFQCMDQDFTAAAQRGFKVILRFSYNWRKTHSGEYYDDFNDQNSNPCRGKNSESNHCEASIAQILKHLGQNDFGDFIKKNAGRISVWQAGFLGKYGEWYYTAEEAGIKDESNMKARLPILKRMLEMLPQGMIQVRTPFYKEYAIRALPNQTNDDKNLIKDFTERIGIFDDSFFDNDKYSTFASYSSSAPESKQFWKDYVSNENTHVAIGGETSDFVVIKKPKSDSEIEEVLAEFRKYHWSFFNYAKLTKEIDDMNWTYLYQDKKKRIQKYLGYRLYLTQSQYDSHVQVGNEIAVKLMLANSGFAAPYSNKRVEVFLCVSGSTTCMVEAARPAVNIDMRTWIPEKPISVPFTVPTVGLKAGEYDLYVRFADIDPSMAQQPVFSIQLANSAKAFRNNSKMGAFSWNSSLGANKFGTVSIK